MKACCAWAWIIENTPEKENIDSMELDLVKWVHVEPSSKCNAWCPACSRNNQGYGLAPGVVEQDLDPAVFENIISQLPNLYGIQLCGNLGDPVASGYFNKIIDISEKYAKKIHIHTNGGLRNVNWWKKLAIRLKNIEHDVWFGIDGLAGVHEIYRQGTDFNKVIKNAQSFINHGGYATWQFIPYLHNEHQTLECLKMSQNLNFKKFKLTTAHRDQTTARHYKTGKSFELLPTNKFSKAISVVSINSTNTMVKPENCMHLSMPSIYVSANGTIRRCCFFSEIDQFHTTKDLSSITFNSKDRKCIINCG